MPQITDWIAQSYTTNSVPFNSSRVVNMFAEQEVQDAKSKSPVGIWMHPGTAPFANCGTGPILAFTTMTGFVFAITTHSLYRIEHSGVATYLGATSVSPNGCSVDNNGQTICWVDGIAGYTYNTTNGVRRITDVNFFPSITVSYYDTYFVFARKGTQQFFISPPQWNGTDALDGAMFASKEATPDLIVAIANSHEQLFVFGEKRCEVWYDAGNAAPQFPFQRSFGALIQRGLMAPYTVVLEDNTLFFLGDDLMFYRLNGFVPERRSNHAIETQWMKYTGHGFAKAFSYTVMGHKMIAITFPTAHATWVLDLATNRWHERESWTADDHDSSIGRWRVNCALNNSSSITRYPEVLFGDSLSGRIDQLNNNVFTEFGHTMRALIVGPPLHSDRRRVFMKKFELDVESGIGAPYSQQVLNEFCPAAITLTSPSQLMTERELLGVGDSFTSFVFSNWVRLPSDGSQGGMMFSSSYFDVWISNRGFISTTAYDIDNDIIFDLDWPWTIWGHWVWVGISVDVTTQQYQCWVRTEGYPDQQLTADYVIWGSTNPIPNYPGDPWVLRPAE